MLTLNETFEFRGQEVRWGHVGDGDPIILVHGFPFSAQVWRRIAPWLADERSVYYFDLVGCGQSEKFEGQDVRAAVQNDLLAELIEYWRLDRPEVVAHDFGGLATLRAYFVNGVRYGKATFIDPVSLLPSGSPFFAHVREHEAAMAGLPAYAHEALFRAYIGAASFKPLSDEAIATYLAPWQGETGQSAFYRQIAQSDTKFISEVADRYCKLDCKVQLLWGEEDRFIDIEQGERLSEALSVDRFIRVPDAGHLVHEDAPEAIMAALLTW